MLNTVTQIDENAISRLLSVYSESMDEMKANFADYAEMCGAYEAFLRDFAANPKQKILVETYDDEWVSALRAIETAHGRWFLEAVETKPAERKKGYGKALLTHTVDYLRSLGMTEVTCTIAKNNHESQLLHEKCGFLPTDEPPLNCWDELEEGRILYRMKI